MHIPEIYCFDLCGTGCSIIRTPSQDLPYRLRVWITDAGGDCFTNERFYSKGEMAPCPVDLVKFRILLDASLWFEAASTNYPRTKARIMTVAHQLKSDSTFSAERYRKSLCTGKGSESLVMGNKVHDPRIQRAEDLARKAQYSLFGSDDPNHFS